jgi:hypothetical protein
LRENRSNSGSSFYNFPRRFFPHFLHGEEQILELTFEVVEAILMMLDAASQRTGGLLSQPPKFGTAVMLTVDEFNNVQQHLNQLGIVAMNARQNTVFHVDLVAR